MSSQYPRSRPNSSSSPMPPLTPRSSISEASKGNGLATTTIPLPSPTLVITGSEMNRRGKKAYRHGGLSNSLQYEKEDEEEGEVYESAQDTTQQPQPQVPKSTSLLNPTGLTRSSSASSTSSSNSTPKPILTTRSTSTGSRYRPGQAHDDTIAEALSAKLKASLSVGSSSPSTPPLPTIPRSNGTNSPALGIIPPTQQQQQQWAASAMLNGGIAAVSPDVHARILTFQQSRQSRSNSGSNGALNFVPGSIPAAGSAASPSPPTLSGLPLKDNLSRSSSSGSSTTSSYSNYSRTMPSSSYSSPIVSPHADEKPDKPDNNERPLSFQVPQRPNNLQLQIPSNEDIKKNSPTNSASSIATITAAPSNALSSSAPANVTTPTPTSSTASSYSGALFINPSLSGANKLQAQRPSLSQRRGLNLSDVGKSSSPIPKLNSSPVVPLANMKPPSLLLRRQEKSAPSFIPQRANLNFSSANGNDNNSNGRLPNSASNMSLRSTEESDTTSTSGIMSPTSDSSSSTQSTSSVLRPPGVGGFHRQQQNTSLFSNYKKYVDVKSGSLNFAGKASVHSKGIDFSSGSSFRISIDEFEPMGELGRGNYGTVTKVLHKPTNITMAMKEIRLELDETKFRQILMELEVLHKCDSPFIVDFYGAFFVEGAVYMCMEYMDGGSLNNIYQGGVEERYLAIIANAVVRGLRRLKDQHNIIHRDVKPTNILVSTSGKVKLCDFGVSGNLVASIARTNVGCQSYMAPERIRSKNPNEAITYTVESDIWSLGLSIIEIASGEYPYPADTHNSIYSQLMAILDGEPPALPEGKYSPEARSFVAQCLNKTPRLRPSYAQLLEHPWLININNELANSPTLEIEFGAFVKRSVERINHDK